MKIQSRKASWLLPVAMAVAGLLLLMAATAQGQGTGAGPGDLAQPQAYPLFWSEDFSDPFPPDTYYITATTGSGMVEDDYFLLTQDAGHQRGRIFYLAPTAMAAFSATFHVYLGGDDGGADGAAFHFCPVYDYPPADGSDLDALCPGGYLVAFDTWEDNNTGPDRVYVAHGTPSNRLVSEDVPELEDGAWHTATVLFQQPFITVTLDGSDIITGAELTGYIPFFGTFGFSAATGGASNEQRVDDIQVYALEVPTSVVDGYVTDAATGWPLYASVDTNSPAGVVWTDPETGYYSISLPEGAAFDFHVEAWVPGYIPEDRVVGPISGDTHEDFALDADLDACIAPGYGTEILYSQDFEADNGGFSTYGTNSTWQWGEPTSGPGSAHSGVMVWATNLAGHHGNQEDSYVESPDIDLSPFAGSGFSLSWWQWLQTESGFDYGEVQVSNDGGTSWTTVFGPVSGDIDMSWAQRAVLLDSSFAVSNFRVRFHLYTDSAGTRPGWYVDDIDTSTICQPQPGGLVVGNVYDENTLDSLVGAKVENGTGGETYALATPGDPNVDDAFYTLFSPPGDHLFTASFVPPYGFDHATVTVVDGGTVGQDFYLPAPCWAEDFSDPLPPETYYITATTGSGMVEDDYFLLTQEAGHERGRIFYLAPTAMVEFSATFHLYLGSDEGGADGAALHFCPVYDYPPADGSDLDALCPGGYLVAFDTYEGEDGIGPDRVYVAHGTPSNRLAVADVDNLEDGAWHTAAVLFQQPFITVTLDGSDVIAGAELTGYTPFLGYFGFSAATGGASNEQRVDDIQVCYQGQLYSYYYLPLIHKNHE
jgi:hypothetical protein